MWGRRGPLSSVARGARRAEERPGTGRDALSGAGCATTESGGVLPQRRHLQSHHRADCPYLAVLRTSADKPQPGLAASFSRRWPQHSCPRKAAWGSRQMPRIQVSSSPSFRRSWGSCRTQWDYLFLFKQPSKGP